MIGGVPEEGVVSAMRDDVVDDGGCPDDRRVFLCTQSAERMLCEVGFAITLPACIVAPLTGAAAVSIILPPGLLQMLRAVAGLVVGQVRAARITTGPGWFYRHHSLSVYFLSYNREPGRGVESTIGMSTVELDAAAFRDLHEDILMPGFDWPRAEAAAVLNLRNPYF